MKPSPRLYQMLIRPNQGQTFYLKINRVGGIQILSKLGNKYNKIHQQKI